MEIENKFCIFKMLLNIQNLFGNISECSVETMFTQNVPNNRKCSETLQRVLQKMFNQKVF